VGKKKAVFRGERRVVLNSIISVITAGRLIKKGYLSWLAHVRELKKGSIELARIPIIR
jgi:hypothetical protein